ncbi:hypothetical protein G4D82_09790 [Flavobacterium sp. CYK-4]|uniref:hypothetical protein n=1 Tax=Flavobacterium lotistagni TaxID=2709660 RepID=UPI0014081600|nr:hypothetical protein [Flavobacterium lotistagni]NHM07511.1 hypothetical protein [Flavobacterium lotistagni]
MKNLVVILLFLNLNAFAQNDFDKAKLIDQTIYKYSSKTNNRIKLPKIEFDSIKVNAFRRRNYIQANNFFKKSATQITIMYYFDNDSLRLIKVTEPSPSSKECYFIHSFYIENKKIFFEREGSQVSAIYAEIGLPNNKSVYEIFGYNRFLNIEFLKKYVFELYHKL